MASSNKFLEPIPDRRRTKFALNGGPRITAAQRGRALRGIAAARQALAATEAGSPRHRTVEPMTTEQRERARRGLDEARDALSA